MAQRTVRHAPGRRYRESADLPGASAAPGVPGPASNTSVLTGEVSAIDMVFETVALELHRLDRGTSLSRVQSVADEDVLLIRADLGFSMAGLAHVSDAAYAIATVSGNPRSPVIWDGRFVQPEEALLYGPGSVQRPVDPDGMRVEVVSVGSAALEEVADTLGYALPAWRGRRATAAPRAAQALLTMIRSGFAELDAYGDRREVLRLAAAAFSDPLEPENSRIRTRGSTDEWIISRVLEYLDENGRWFPPMAELCVAAAVSERRLRDAFVRSYGAPPSRYLRARALSEVRRRLLEAPPGTGSVTRVAHDHGFRHMGQFGQHYRQAFGETPSVALRSAEGSAGKGAREADRP